MPGTEKRAGVCDFDLESNDVVVVTVVKPNGDAYIVYKEKMVEEDGKINYNLTADYKVKTK